VRLGGEIHQIVRETNAPTVIVAEPEPVLRNLVAHALPADEGQLAARRLPGAADEAADGAGTEHHDMRGDEANS
jgi:hypothetical protein